MTAEPSSLTTAAARNLTSTTKTVPQAQSISPRWLLRMLLWKHVAGGSYRVNRRLRYVAGDGRVSFTSTGAEVRVIPGELTQLPLLRGLADEAVLAALADRFVQREFQPGDLIVHMGQPTDRLHLLAHGKASKLTAGRYADPASLGVLADGDYFGDGMLSERDGTWAFTIRAVTPCTVLTLGRDSLRQLEERHLDAVREQVRRVLARRALPRNKHGEADIALASGHAGEPELPHTFVDYELPPREYELSLAQTVLRVHTRVADLYSGAIDQVEQQLRLTIEALRDRQEHELINNRDFGLLHNADLSQRIHTRTGPPTPDDLDELLSRRRKSQFFLAHPRTIAAFGRQCNRRGIYPQPVAVDGTMITAWRGVPILPCDKIPITAAGTSSLLVMRTGEDSSGVVGLRQTGIPDEYQPGLSVRLLGIDHRAIASYLVSAYYSAAVLTPDALGILENIEVMR